MADTIVGYHGTNRKNLSSIKNNNFKLKKDRNHWLGNGVYFFY